MNLAIAGLYLLHENIHSKLSLQNASNLGSNRQTSLGIREALAELATVRLRLVPIWISGRGLPVAKLGVSGVPRGSLLDLSLRSFGLMS